MHPLFAVILIHDGSWGSELGKTQKGLKDPQGSWQPLDSFGPCDCRCPLKSKFSDSVSVFPTSVPNLSLATDTNVNTTHRHLQVFRFFKQAALYVREKARHL